MDIKIDVEKMDKFEDYVEFMANQIIKGLAVPKEILCIEDFDEQRCLESMRTKPENDLFEDIMIGA